MSVLETIATVTLAVLAIAGVAYAAYCNDVAMQEWRESQNAAGDRLTSADLIRMGIVNDDGAVSGIEAGAPYWLNNRINSAVPGRDECGQPTEQVANSSDPVNGLPRGGGLGDWVAPNSEATPSSRASGEAAGHD